VRAITVSHGLASNGVDVYGSTAFFVRRSSSAAEFLFFGDVEPDTVSSAPRNRDVWRAAAARRIPDVLSALFIECSWPAGRPDADLYGHLSPAHLHAELCALAHEVALARRSNTVGPVRKKRRHNPSTQRELPPPPPPSDPDVRGALRGLRVFIIHCKDGPEDDAGRPVSEMITEQVRELVDADALGAEILHARQGMRICECLLIAHSSEVDRPSAAI
jgi:cAMP phosphodiesterase